MTKSKDVQKRKEDDRLVPQRLDALIAHLKNIGRINGWEYPKDFDEE